jgi:hypothetical protein
MFSSIRKARDQRILTGLECGSGVSAPGQFNTRPMTPASADQTDPDRGTGELGIEGLDRGAPLDDE